MNGGHDETGLVLLELLDEELEVALAAPTAMEESMLGLSVVIKLPQMVWNARAKSGPTWPPGGRKYAVGQRAVSDGATGIPKEASNRHLRPDGQDSPFTSAPCKAGGTLN